MQLVLEECLAKGDPHFTLTGVRVLPSIEPDGADDVVDIINDALHHYGRIAILRLLKQLGERGLALIDIFFNRSLAFELDRIFG